MKWKEEDLEAFQRRTEAWRKEGTTRTHLMPGKEIVRKRSKYGNKKTEVDGLVFDSQKEASRWNDLKLMERAGEIIDLKRQVNYALEINGQLICSYKADFTYRKTGRRELIVEDAKGYRTQIYGIKKKMMKAILGIEILET